MSPSNALDDNNDVPQTVGSRLPVGESPFGRIEPSGASYPVEFLMNVKLESEFGSDIPLCDRRIERTNKSDPQTIPEFKRVWGKEFDFKKEDYWLFCVHLHNAEIEIAINGEEPTYATSERNWRNWSERHDPYLDWQNITSISTWAEFNLDYNRYVAVRASKTDNPAITVKGNGHFAALNWVGLFVQNCSDNTNEFVALKTHARVLPKYADRVKDENWFDLNCGSDITGRTITMFPKQLYGTGGKNQETYDKFVTSDPENNLGNVHLDMVKNSCTNATKLGYSYTWNASGKPWIVGVRRADLGIFGHHDVKEFFNYCQGAAIERKHVNGLDMLLGIFLTVTGIATALLTSNLAGALQGIKNFTDVINGTSANPDAEGMITSAVKLGKAVWDKAHGKNKAIENTNTADVPEIVTRLNGVNFKKSDLGSASRFSIAI